MKSWMQKLISVLMSLALVMSLGTTAFAGDEGTVDSGPTQEELAEQERIRQEEERRRREAEEAAAKAAAEQEITEKVTAQDNDAQYNPEEKSIQKQEKEDVELKDEFQKEDVKDELQKEDVKDELRKEDVKDELQKEDIKGELQKEDVKDELRKEDVKDELQKEDVKDELQKEDVKDELQKEDVKDELQKEDVKDELKITGSKQEEDPTDDEKDGADQNDPQPILPLDSMFKLDAKNYQVTKAALLMNNAEENGSDSSEKLGNRSDGSMPADTSAGNTQLLIPTNTRDTSGGQGNANNLDPFTGANGTASQGGDTVSIKGGGTITMTTEQFKELTVKDGDLTIQAAGFNRINSLVTNSVVNIIGTGILLIDDYDMQDSGEVKLTENLMYEETGVVGSVAVFLKDKGASTSGNSTYKLINHGIPGILDESYTIPSGVNLVLPSGESLIMNSSVAVKNSESKTGYNYYSGDSTSALSGNVIENSAELTVSSGASLTVEKGATVKMVGTKSVSATTKPNILTPIIRVADGGSLAVEGLLKGLGRVDLLGSAIIDTNDSDGEPMAVVKGTNTVTQLWKTLYDKGIAAGAEIGFQDFYDAWTSLYGPPPATGLGGFVITIYGDSESDTKVVTITKDGGETTTFPESPEKWGVVDGSPYTGMGLGKHELGATGSGLLIDPSFKFPGGSSKVILTAAEKNLWRVIVTENPKRGTWTLSVWYGDTQIFDLGVTTVRARFKFDKPEEWDTKNIYVVFIDKDGKSLKAFPATYDTVTGELVFDSSLVGEFVVVQFDYQGELYSKGFYDELAKQDAVKHLVDLHKGKVN